MADSTQNDNHNHETNRRFFVDTETRPLKKVTKPKFNIKFSNIFTRYFRKRKNIDDFIKHDIISTDLIEVEKNELNTENLNNVNKDYNFVYKFAEGGQGFIYSAIDKNLGRLVAIKTLRSEFAANSQYRQNFVSEAKITAQLDHPGIVPVYSLNSDDNSNLFMAMKLVHGQSLDEYINKIIFNYQSEGIDSFDEEKSLRNRLEIILRVCDALAYAHSKNIMHCDLKGENIMIGEFHEVFVTDWGFARFIKDSNFNAENWKKPEKLIGTPGYLSPEAINGEYTDQRADIFSIGAVLFKVVFLKNAFNGQTANEILHKIYDGKVSSFKHKFNFRISRDLIAIIKKALAHDPKHRYQQIADLSDDIRRYLHCYSVSARTDNIISKFIRWSKRHTAFLFIVALLGVFGAIFSLGYNFFIQKFVMPYQHHLENQELIELVNSLRKLEHSTHTMHYLGNSMQQIGNIASCLYLDENGCVKSSEQNFSDLKKLIDIIFRENDLLLGIKLTHNDGNVFYYCRHNCAEKNRMVRGKKIDPSIINFSVPVFNEHLKQFVNYLDLPIYDKNNQPIGYLTTIIDTNKIQQIFSSESFSTSLADVFWVNNEGKIIFKRSNDYNKPELIEQISSTNNKLQEMFEDKVIWVKIKQQKFGLAFANDDNRSDIIYSFIYFADLDLYYIEKINLKQLENFKFHTHENYWEIIKNFYKQYLNKKEDLNGKN